jgi:hypothetical protein
LQLFCGAPVNSSPFSLQFVHHLTYHHYTATSLSHSRNNWYSGCQLSLMHNLTCTTVTRTEQHIRYCYATFYLYLQRGRLSQNSKTLITSWQHSPYST